MDHFRKLLSWPNLSRASFHVFTFLTHILSSLGSNETTLCFPFTPRAIVAQSPLQASHSASFSKCQQLLRGLSPQTSRRSCEAGGGASLAHQQNSQCLWVHLSQSASQPHTEQVHRDNNTQTILCYTCHRQEKWTGGLWWGVLLGKWLHRGRPTWEQRKEERRIKGKQQRSTKTKLSFTPLLRAGSVVQRLPCTTEGARRCSQLPHQSPESLATDTLGRRPWRSTPWMSLSAELKNPPHPLSQKLPSTHPATPASLYSSFPD